jgi:hypothetical protein
MLTCLVVWCQRVALWLSYVVCRTPLLRCRKVYAWVVGPDEIAANVAYIGRALGDACLVNLVTNRFYGHDYHISLPRLPASVQVGLRLLIGPVILGYLASRSDAFFYIGSGGFLLEHDGRDWEFRFLRRRKKNIVCFFCGSDIRSPALMADLQKTTGIDNISTYLHLSFPAALLPKYDRSKRLLAAAADRHASIIFNARVDQSSYLTRETIPFIYFCLLYTSPSPRDH